MRRRWRPRVLWSLFGNGQHVVYVGGRLAATPWGRRVALEAHLRACPSTWGPLQGVTRLDGGAQYVFRTRVPAERPVAPLTR